MEHLAHRILTQAEAEGRFEHKDTDLLEIWAYSVGVNFELTGTCLLILDEGSSS